MPATSIETARLKINALERLRILGNAAITVIPLARYHSCLIATIIRTIKPYQDCQPSSTAASPHGMLFLVNSYIIIHSPAERLSRIRLGESNVRNKRNATPAVPETNAIRSQNPSSSPGIDTWLAFLVRLYARIDLRHTHTTASWCEDLTRIRG